MTDTSSQPDTPTREPVPVKTLVAALLPGGGQIAGGRLLRGLACGVVVSLLVSLVVLDRWVVVSFLPGRLPLWMGVAAAVVYVLSWVDTMVLVQRRRSADRRHRRIELLRAGNLDVICGRLDQALLRYHEVMELDRFDIGTLLKIARVEILLDRRRQAASHLAVCRNLDEHGHWRYPIAAARAMVNPPEADPAQGPSTPQTPGSPS